ncbi:MAG: hypothetical protein AAF612_12660 [Planctomycetota bacterium]
MPRPSLATLRSALRRMHCDTRGAATVEWALLAAAFVLQSYLVIRTGLDVLVAHYEMVTDLIALPTP